MRRILLNGVGFVNKGGEAMLRTVQQELSTRLPSIDLYLWRPQAWECCETYLSGLNPLCLPAESPCSLLRVLRRPLNELIWGVSEVIRAGDLRQLGSHGGGLSARACELYLRRTGLGFDALVDISGFAYGDAWGTGLFSRTQPLVRYCQHHRKPAVFLPQTWGSFSHLEYASPSRSYWEPPPRSSMPVMSSPVATSKALWIGLGGPSTPFRILCFEFQGGTAQQGEHVLRSMGCALQRPIIGVAPNMRVYERCAGKGTDNTYVRALVQLVCHCLEHLDVDVVLQANEINPYGTRPDDRYLCSLMAATVGRPDRCFMTRQPLTAEESSALIGRFAYLVGSRFHSLVFAFTQGVPCMAVSWSSKYRELFSVFGMQEAVLECQEIDANDLIATFERGWSERDGRRPQIREKVSALQAQVDALFDQVALVVRGKVEDRNA